jgi:2,4-dienoyl-CoA reductase-like NADH-dependent reductase (Old Yellow Enzyme family)
MWRPKQRIKYEADPGVWPSAEQANDSLLFTPLHVGRLTLSQRTWVPAMVPWRSNEQGEVTQDVLDWYQRFAEGKPGAIVVEATGIRDIASGPLLRISNDSYIDRLTKLVDIIRQASDGETKVFIQIIDFLSIRRRPDREKYLGIFLQITPSHQQRLQETDQQKVRDLLREKTDDELSEILDPKEMEALTHGYRQRVTDTELDEIAELPEQLPVLFAEAAQRAEQAGFDGVELHYAHAYTMASFLSRTNTREDKYGGSQENRVRLPLEVFHKLRKSVGDDFIVGCRFLSDEIVEHGSTVDDAVFFANQFADAGMDFISVSRGGKFDDAKQPKVGAAAYPYTGQSGYECMPQYVSDEQGPFGRNLLPSERIKKSLLENGFDIPLVTAGGIHNFEKAEQVLQEGQADIVGFARQALADPDFFKKVKVGDGEKVTLCRYSNYCEALDQKHKQVTCELWDRTNLDEPNISKSFDGKRRLIAPRS